VPPQLSVIVRRQKELRQADASRSIHTVLRKHGQLQKMRPIKRQHLVVDSTALGRLRGRPFCVRRLLSGIAL
jgi:hypothetical protein